MTVPVPSPADHGATPGRHGGETRPPVEALLTDDQELHLVWASMNDYYETQPCDDCGEPLVRCACDE